MGRTRTTAVVLGATAAAVLGVLGPVPSAGAAPPAGTAAATRAAAAGEQVGRVTLVTGDRVLVRPGGRVDVRPGPGRAGMTFVRQTVRGHTIVLPADASRGVAAGTLDRRLFDVTALLAYGYSDDRRADLPLVVSHPEGVTARTTGATGTRKLPGGTATALRAPKATTNQVWRSLTTARSGVTKVWLDGRVTATLDRSVPQIGAPAAWAAGHTGAGATVAVLDTGIDTDHPDFAGAVAGSRDFTDNPAGVEDGDGHGTHVASTVTGSGAASAGRYRGVAPDARLLIGKVLDDTGSGYESQIIAGMEWAATEGADVVNMSLGSPFESDGTDLMSRELNRLTRETGTLFVVAAGNSGPSEGTIGSPAAADEALTVGAVDARNALAYFSSRGPRAGDAAIKPDLTAPGVDIVAARATGSGLGDPVGADYQRLSGTSMATPHVAGAAAILAGQHPDWTPARIKAVLVGSAAPSRGAPVDAQGAGRVDLARATRQTASVSPVSVAGGVARWPHADDTPINRRITYSNPGTAPLTLTLTTDFRGPTGARAPAGLLRLSTGSLTVPAGGTAKATVRFDTRVTAPDGRYSGLLTATGRDGRTVIRTALSVDREVESYDVTMPVTDRTGAPTPYASAWFLALDGTVAKYAGNGRPGTLVARLPKGSYYMDGWVQPADGGFELTTFVEPTVVVDRNRTLPLDGPAAVPLGMRVERPAKAGLAGLIVQRRSAGIELWSGIFGSDFAQLFARPSRTSAPAGQFTVSLEGTLARPDGAGGFAGSPYQYRLSWSAQRRIPANLVPRFRDRDLGLSQTTVASAGTGLTGVKDGVATLALPARLTELYSPGVDWIGDVMVFTGTPWETTPVTSWFSEVPRRYTAGRTVSERWGGAVNGPLVPGSAAGMGSVAVRVDDELYVDLSLHGDAAGHVGYAESAGTTTLTRNGVPLASTPYPGGGMWAVPRGAATYRMTMTATGPGAGGLSTSVTAAWTFRSGRPAEGVQSLPLLGIRFRPPVDLRNSAPAGELFAVPVRVQKTAGAPFGRVGAPTVSVSYDEGRTWRAAPVVGGHVLLTHPAGATSVSLRAKASDSAGNKVEQTILRAYTLR